MRRFLLGSLSSIRNQRSSTTRCFITASETLDSPYLISGPQNVRNLTSNQENSNETVTAIVEELSELTLLEVADLTEILRKKLGIEEMPVMAVMMPGMGFGGAMPARGATGAAKVEEKKEKTAFDLKLESFDAAAKIKIIKEVRTFTDLGLKEAKELVEKAPAVLKKGVLKEEAEKIVEKMKEIGAKVIME